MKNFTIVLTLFSATIFKVPCVMAGIGADTLKSSDPVITENQIDDQVPSLMNVSGRTDEEPGPVTVGDTLEIRNPENPDLDRQIATPDLTRQGKNAVYLEMFGNSLNLISLNYERMLSPQLNIRIGGSYLGFSRKAGYEGDLDDLFVDLYSVPATLSFMLFEGIRQLELGIGTTFFSFSFFGGTYDVGYHDIDLGKNYTGIALTSVVGYRVSIQDYIFRIGLSPYYMLTIDSELSGFFKEMNDRGIMDLHDWINFEGYHLIPGLSFGKSF